MKGYAVERTNKVEVRRDELSEETERVVGGIYGKNTDERATKTETDKRTE